MNELALFAGAGGGILGSRILGHRLVGCVEIDGYCQRVLASRMADGFLDPAPIFGDVRAFLRDGLARSYRGVAELVSAGFPCQPFSLAGSRLGAADDRNLWPETIAVLRDVRPRVALLENVPGLTARERLRLLVVDRPQQRGLFDAGVPGSRDGRGICRRVVEARGGSYFARVLGDLAEAGFDAEWGVYSARDVGAPHIRERLWIVAHADRCGCDGERLEERRDE